MTDTSLAHRAVRRAKGIRSGWASRYFVNLGAADPDIIFIAGTGRSGTTWLAEVLARASRRRLVFEPFRNDRVPQWSRAASRQYIRPDDAASPFLEPAREILSRRFRDEWADAHNERFLTRGRIVKEIRANLMLRWLYDQLGPFPIIFVIRNPGAVAVSWMRGGWALQLDEVFGRQPAFVQDHLGPMVAKLNSAMTPLEQAAYTWSIETSAALASLPPDSKVVFYEELLLDPVEELRRVASVARCRIADSATLTRASATTHPSTLYASARERLSAWQRFLAPRELEVIHSIASQFGLGELYADNGLPSTNAAFDISRSHG